MMTLRFLLKAQLGQARIADHQIARDQRHFDDRFPFPILALAGRLQMRRVVVRPFLAVVFHPVQRPLVFLGVKNLLFDPARKFAHVNVFVPHAQIFLEKGVVHHRTRDAHRYRSHREIGLITHHRRRQPAAGKTQQLLLHIVRNPVVAFVLHVFPVNAERRQPFLRVRGQDRRQIDRPRPPGAVKAPHRFRNQRVGIHRFRAITPARGHRDR